MNTKQIQYILELAQVKNFNRAAENMFISQPTLSYQIKAAEAEIGFRLFERSGKGAELTPAGEQFCLTLRNIYKELTAAIEQGQNFSTRYQGSITLGLPMRSCLHFLPEAIIEFEQTHPDIAVMPHFLPLNDVSSFLKGEENLLFAMEHDVHHLPDIKLHYLFDSHIYLISKPDDVLAKKQLIEIDDLRGRTLMIGGGSPPKLRQVQQRVLQALKLNYFNSHDHETTLTNIAANKGICLAPGFLNDHTGEFAWTRFNCPEVITCVLCSHANADRTDIQQFIQTLQHLYQQNSNFAL